MPGQADTSDTRKSADGARRPQPRRDQPVDRVDGHDLHGRDLVADLARAEVGGHGRAAGAGDEQGGGDGRRLAHDGQHHGRAGGRLGAELAVERADVQGDHHAERDRDEDHREAGDLGDEPALARGTPSTSAARPQVLRRPSRETANMLPRLPDDELDLAEHAVRHQTVMISSSVIAGVGELARLLRRPAPSRCRSRSVAISSMPMGPLARPARNWRMIGLSVVAHLLLAGELHQARSGTARRCSRRCASPTGCCG